MNRPQPIPAVCGALSCAAVLLAASQSPAGPPAAAIEVRETAGIRRFHYPVTARVRLDTAAGELGSLELAADGKPVEAQWSLAAAGDGSVEVVVDFESSLLPFASRTYSILPLAGAARELRGLSLEESSDRYRIQHRGELEWSVPRANGRLIDAFRARGLSFLRPHGDGLMVRLRSGIAWKLSAPARSRVIKRGPVAYAVELEWDEELPGGARVRSRVEIEFPRAKSWAQVRWQLADHSSAVESLSFGLDLELEDERVFVDFGAGTFVYAALAPGQAARLEAPVGPELPWQVLRGKAGQPLEPYVTGSRRGATVEGWAHVWDSRRCSAVAMADFGRGGADAMEAHASGRVELSRRFAPPAGADGPATRELTFWIHFVDSPPHAGAATSPQAMLAPLEARQRAR